MRNRKIRMTNLTTWTLMGLLTLRPHVWAQDEVKLQAEPELRKHISVSRKADVGLCMTSPAQLDSCVKATFNGVSYKVGYRRRGLRGNLVTYVHTDDPAFRSPEGLRVGDVVTVENTENIIVAPGFEIYGKRGKGWVPVVGFDGQVSVVLEGNTDEKRDVKVLNPSIKNPAHLRINGFTMR